MKYASLAVCFAYYRHALKLGLALVCILFLAQYTAYAELSTFDDGIAIGGSALSGSLLLDVTGAVGASNYCDAAGNNCATITELAGSIWSENGSTASYSGNTEVSGDVESGTGSGGVALTINDSKGNANVTFNHRDGIPEQNGNAARIEVNTDASTGARMDFELGSGVSSGVSTNLSTIMRLAGGGNVGIGDTSPSQKLEVGGNISMSAGRHLYMGNQDLYGDNNSTLYFDSNDSSVSRFVLRDADNDIFGSLYGAQGDSFGMLDGDGHWFLQHNKDSYTGFRVNNDEKMRITSGGNVGIGTTNPDSLLHVFSDTNSAYDGLKIDTDGDSNNVPFRIRTTPSAGPYTDSDTKFIVQGTGNVGIGTTNPDTKLHVNGSVKADDINVTNRQIFFSSADTSGDYIEWTTTEGLSGYENGNNTWHLGDSNTPTHFSGNVGIGTTNPSASLTVDGRIEGNGNIDMLNGAARLRQMNPGSSLILAANGGSVILRPTDGSGTGQLVVTSSGIVTVAEQIRGYDGSASSPDFSVGGDVDTGMFLAATNEIGFSTAGSEAVRIDSSGNVGIGTGSPSSALDLRGNFTITGENRKTLIDDTQTGADNDKVTSGAELYSQDFVYRGNTLGKISFLNYNTSGTGWYSASDRYDVGMGFTVADGNSQVEALRINNTGNVGIGLSNPSVKLDVDGIIRTRANSTHGDILRAGNFSDNKKVLRSGWTSGFGDWLQIGVPGNSTGNANVMTIGGNGRVGIGDASPDAGLTLDVEGKVGATEYCDENGNNCVAADGSATVIDGWPDTIVCYYDGSSTPGASSHTRLYRLSEIDEDNNRYVYAVPSPGDAYYVIRFNANGTYYNGAVNSDCDNQSITDLANAGKAYGFMVQSF